MKLNRLPVYRWPAPRTLPSRVLAQHTRVLRGAAHASVSRDLTFNTKAG